MEVIDLKLVSFLAVALLQDHYFSLHRPRIYFWSMQDRYANKKTV
ncbi:hypothetical protein ACOI1C_11265 [Bacillus sp. DJP31]